MSLGVYDGYEHRAPRDFYVEGSNNDSDWTMLATMVDVNYDDLAASDTQEMHFDWANPTAYRYIRLTIKTVANSFTSGEGSDFLRIADLKYYEATAQGATGAQGHQGDTGGAQGAQGHQGATGSGAQGHQGHQGAAGAAGSNGSNGSTGAQGHQGHQGAAGAAGSDGSDGSTGAQGHQGHQGSTATINNATENELVTVASTTSQLDAEANLTFDGSKLVLSGNIHTSVHDYGSTVTDLDVNFDEDALQKCTLSGNVNIATGAANKGAGKSIVIKIAAGGSARTFTWNSSWVFVGEKPTSIAANKTAILSMTCFGTNETDVVCSYAVQD